MQLQPISRVSEFTRSAQSALLDQILEILRRRGAGRSRDRDIVLGAQSTFESVRPSVEQPGDYLALAGVELIAIPVIEMRLGY